MVAIFAETDYHANLDLDALRKICKYFEKLAPERMLSHQPINPIDPEILLHHIPGGMISNLRSQLEQQGALDRLDEVLEELPRVREDMGYPPLVTPTSQIVGVQSVMNVLTGKRYELVPEETRNYVRGLYGKSPAPIKADVRRKILGKEKAVTCRPADQLAPMLPTATDDLDPKLIQAEEDIISYCLFPEVALDFFKWRALPFEERPSPPAEIERRKAEAGRKMAPALVPEPPRPFLATTDYKEIGHLLERVNALGLSELTIRRDDLNLSFKSAGVTSSQAHNAPAAAPAERGAQTAAPKPAPAAPAPAAKPAPAASAPAVADKAEGLTIDSPLAGTFYRSSTPGKPPFVEEGADVKAGQTVCVVEAMKLFNEIKTPADGKLVKFLMEHGTPVKKGDQLAVIRPA